MITLIFGSGGLAFDVIRHVEFLGSRAAQIDFTSPSKVPSLPATPDLSGLLDQYLGSPESTFNRHLARPLPLVNDSVPYNGEAPPEGVIAKQNRMQLDLRHRFDHGERSLDFLREYGTISYYQGDLWESMLAFETIVESYPKDPSGRVTLANLLSSSGIESYRERARSELLTARSLFPDPIGFDEATKGLRQLLGPPPKNDSN